VARSESRESKGGEIVEIKILDYTNIHPLIEACNQPYQSEGGAGLVKRVWDSGHRSIARHGMISFEIKGVSQSLLRQLSRHPHINLTVKSSRYCDMTEEIRNGVVPPFAREKERELLILAYDKACKLYEVLLNSKDYTTEQQHELAKLVIPLGATLTLTLSGNYQAMYEFLQLRVCERAEWEIRNLAKKLAILCKSWLPAIFDSLGCKGAELGYCPEHDSCGRFKNVD
jgi:thymidylate synthase (FAD)